jgi:hypothetical protein
MLINALLSEDNADDYNLFRIPDIRIKIDCRQVPYTQIRGECFLLQKNPGNFLKICSIPS